MSKNIIKKWHYDKENVLLKLNFLMKFIFRKIQMIWIDLIDPLPHLQVDLPLDMEVLSN